VTRRGRAPALLLTLLAASAPLFLGGAQAQASTSYRYWAYYLGASSGGWNYASRGPATDFPADGDVQGWRFAVQAESADLPPRAAPNFASLCSSTAPVAGRIRVGVVIDFGTATDAPAGDPPPAGPVVGCVVVPAGASGIAVLDAAVGSGGVRIGTGSDTGLVCGIAGYPRAECAVAVANPKPPAPTPSASATATTSALAIEATSKSAPRTTPEPTSKATFAATPRANPTAAATPTTAPGSAVATNSGAAPALPASAPSASPASSTAAASATAPPPSALPLKTLVATGNMTVTRGPPITAFVGGVLILALGTASAIRLRRSRRSRQAGP
jgi:hypothetical protein